MIHDSIKKIFLMVFENADITEETSIYNFEKWDSLGHAKLIVTLEQYFRIKLNFNEITQLTIVKNIQDVMLKKGVLS